MNDVIVSLDNMDQQEAINLAKILKGHVWGFRINDLIATYGANIIKCLKQFGGVFVDLKLHDAPKTVYNLTRIFSAGGADLISVHLSGGIKMVKLAREAAYSTNKNTKIIGVTMLDNLDFSEIRETYRGYPIERFFNIVTKSGVDGIISADHEIPFWEAAEKTEKSRLIKIVPNIHPFGPVPIIEADYLVVGDAITKSKDPKSIIDSIKNLYVEDEAS